MLERGKGGGGLGDVSQPQRSPEGGRTSLKNRAKVRENFVLPGERGETHNNRLSIRSM